MLVHRFHPHPSPLPSRERGFCRLLCIVGSLTLPCRFPAYAGMTVWDAGNDDGGMRGMTVSFARGFSK